MLSFQEGKMLDHFNYVNKTFLGFSRVQVANKIHFKQVLAAAAVIPPLEKRRPSSTQYLPIFVTGRLKMDKLKQTEWSIRGDKGGKIPNVTLKMLS